MTENGIKVLIATLEAFGSIGAAIILGIVANRIRDRYQKEKDRQDKDAQWRQHAIDLTRLELERKIEQFKKSTQPDLPIRSVIDDFLAFYRDLNELGPTGEGQKSVKELYLEIMTRRKTFQDDTLLDSIRAKLLEGDIRKAEDLVMESKIHAMEVLLSEPRKASKG